MNEFSGNTNRKRPLPLGRNRRTPAFLAWGKGNLTSKKSTSMQKEVHGKVSTDIRKVPVTINSGKRAQARIVPRKEITKALKSLNAKERVVNLRETREPKNRKTESIEAIVPLKTAKKIQSQKKSEPKAEANVAPSLFSGRSQKTHNFLKPAFTLNTIQATESSGKKEKSGILGFIKSYFKTIKDWRLSSAFSLNFKASFVWFVLFAFIFTYTVHSFAFVTDNVYEAKDKVVDNAGIGYHYMTSASNSLVDKDFHLAEYKFGVAAERFFSSKEEIDSLSRGLTGVLEHVPGGTQVTTAENLLQAGGNLAVAGEYATKAMEPFSESQDLFEAIKENEEEYDRAAEVNKDQQTLTEALAVSSENLHLALGKIKEAEGDLENVYPEKLPEDLRPSIELAKDKMPKIRASLEYFLSYSDVILEILGNRTFKRYLILFQNNAELRATGGFIGTYGLAELDEGKLTNLKVEGPYNVDGQLTENIVAPEALHLINPRYFMRDANWFADFPTSAKSVSAMHEKAGGPSVDGVIAINANMIVELLKLTGPIEMEEYDVTVTHENFFEETQREVEISYDKELNRPKKFISDLIPKILEKIQGVEQKKWLDVLMVLTGLFDEKDVLVYFNDQNLEGIVQDLGWGGELTETEGDYLNIVSSNIGGGKTDRVIDQETDVQVDVLPDGSVVNTVTVKKTHNGNPSDFWTRVKNVSYMRFYVPEGSELIEAKGFDSELFNLLLPNEDGAIVDPVLDATEGKAAIHAPSHTRMYAETGKKVFGNFVGVEVGETKEVQIKYRLPFNIALSADTPTQHYSMVLEKQPGSMPSHVSFVINYPVSYIASWQYLTDAYVEKKFRRIESEFLLDKDQTFAVVFSK
ncbi:DUF4012 domain-containing protein [Patescibacteria group bacterium]|nr:DUF4012 domain-containing protein [Patescibacteria group bacterium]